MHNAKLKLNSNFVHETAVIDPTVQLGQNNYIGPYCVIGKGAVIGNNNRFEAFCSIASAPEHRDFWNGEHASVVIGDNCIIREYASITSGTKTNTVLGNNVFVLRGAHVCHDSIIEDKVTLSCNSTVGGHSHVCEGANVGLNVSIHQFSIIGPYSMLGMATVVTKRSKIEPFKTYIGKPARFLKNNDMAVQRNNLSIKQIDQVSQKYSDLTKNKK